MRRMGCVDKNKMPDTCETQLWAYMDGQESAGVNYKRSRGKHENQSNQRVSEHHHRAVT